MDSSLTNRGSLPVRDANVTDCQINVSVKGKCQVRVGLSIYAWESQGLLTVKPY